MPIDYLISKADPFGACQSPPNALLDLALGTARRLQGDATMSMPAVVFRCSVCSFRAPGNPVYGLHVYVTKASVEINVPRDCGWCRDCRTIRGVEALEEADHPDLKSRKSPARCLVCGSPRIARGLFECTSDEAVQYWRHPGCNGRISVDLDVMNRVRVRVCEPRKRRYDIEGRRLAD